MEIVSVNEIRYDYTLLSAQLELTKADPTFIVGPGGPPLHLILPHTRLMRFLRDPLHPVCDSDAIGPVEQVKHGHVHRTQSGRGHDRTFCLSHYSVFETIQTPEQHPV